jgi:hypothetical protein
MFRFQHPSCLANSEPNRSRPSAIRSNHDPDVVVGAIPRVEAMIGAVVAVLHVRQTRAFTAEPIRPVMGAWLVTSRQGFRVGN